MIRCAFYERDITPPIGSEIPGYWAKRASTGILDPLYVKVFAADDGERRIALIVIDAVELANEQCDRIVNRVRELTGIEAGSVAVSATHTHYGVPCGEPFGSEEDTAYMDVMCRTAADCVLMAMQRLQPCELSFGTGWVDGISFNRDYVMEDGSVCTNPGKRKDVVRPYAENDPELPVLSVRDQSGRPIGALISFACHQDCIGGSLFSGDFSSEMSRQLKKKYGQDFVSVYVAGASGDINHIDRASETELPYTVRGQRLAEEASRIIDQSNDPVAGEKVQSRREEVPCKLRRATPEQIENAKTIVKTKKSNPNTMLGSLMSELLLDYEEKAEASGEESGELPVQVFSVGDVFIFALAGEMYHQFAERIKSSCPGRKCIISTLSHGMYGYIPVPELLGTDIYPAQLCAGSRWEAAAGDIVVEKAVQIMEELSDRR